MNPQTAVQVNPDKDSTTQSDKADRWLLAGALCCGTIMLGPLGLILIAVGLGKLHRARRLGEWVRPTAVTVFGMFALVDERAVEPAERAEAGGVRE